MRLKYPLWNIIAMVASVILVFVCSDSFAEGNSQNKEAGAEQTESSNDVDKEEKEELEGEKPKTKAEKLPEILVTGKRPQEYGADKATTATKTETPILETPQTVEVVTKDLLEDRIASNLHDVWQNVAGAYTSLGGDGYGNVINFRGFSSAHNLGLSTMVNGLRIGRGSFTHAPRLYNVERVEVLKGPASIYGTMTPGGAANLVSRKPQAISDNSLDVMGGSFGRMRGHLHSSGPTHRDDLFSLFDVGFEEAPKLHVNMEKRNIQFTSSLAWVAGSNTRLDFESGVSNDIRKSVPYHGLPIVNGDPFALPSDFNFTEPTDGGNLTNYYGEIHFNHGFSDVLKLSMGLRGSHSNNESTYHMKSGDPAEDGTLNRMYSEMTSAETPFSMDTNIAWDAEINESMTSGAIAGIDFSAAKSESRGLSARENVASINVFDPVYGLADPSTYTYSPPSEMAVEDYRYGLYIQDELQIIDRIHLLAGTHAEKFHEKVENLVSDQDFIEDNSAITLRGGAVYDIIKDHLSIFGGYSEGYEPQNFTRVMLPRQEGFPWDPKESWQIESGIKGALGTDLIATLSWYTIEKRNILDTDPEDPTYARTIGAAESAGIEISAAGSPMANLSLSMNYSYLYKAEVTEDTDPERVGTRMSSMPEHQTSLWTRYDFGPLGVGLGVNYINGRPPLTPVTTESEIELPDYWLCNAAIYYTLGRYLRLQLNIENVFDKEYLAGMRPTQGASRNFALTASTAF